MPLWLLLRIAGEIVAPSRCVACDERVDARLAPLFCVACATTIEPAGGRSPAVFAYGGALADAIVRMKYRGRPELAARLGEAMAASPLVARARGSVDVVVPVPLTAARLAERGYNQSALIARPVARALGAPLAPRALERTREGPRQAISSREERRANVDGAFSCRERTRVANRRVLLVDDVRTTGATVAACTSALALAGAREVISFVLATRDHEICEAG